MPKLLFKVVLPIICLAIVIGGHGYVMGINTTKIALTLLVWSLAFVLALIPSICRILQGATISFVLINTLALTISAIVVAVVRVLSILDFQKLQDKDDIFGFSAIILAAFFILTPSIGIVKGRMQTIDRKWIYYDTIFSTMFFSAIMYMFFVIALLVWIEEDLMYKALKAAGATKDTPPIVLDSAKKYIMAKLYFVFILPIFIIYFLSLLFSEYAIDKKCKEIYGEPKEKPEVIRQRSADILTYLGILITKIRELFTRSRG